jgi:hypothetical protein
MQGWYGPTPGRKILREGAAFCRREREIFGLHLGFREPRDSERDRADALGRAEGVGDQLD